MMAMPRVIFSILIAITILLMRFADADATLPKVRIQLPWYLSVEWAGIIMAKEKSFDKRFGVDLDILEYASGIDPVQSVTSNKADMGLIDAFSIIMHRARGDKIQAIWAQMQVSPLGICTLRESNITQISDLRGRTFGTDRAYEYLLDIMLARAGVSKDEINIVYLDGDPVIPLEQGMVDAVGCFDTYQAPILRIRGFNPFIIRSSDLGLIFYEQVIFVNRNHIAYSITIKKAIMAINQGWMYALNNIDETVELIVNKYRPFSPKEQLLHTNEQYIAHQKASLKLTRWYMTKGVGTKIGLMRRARWAQNIKALYDMGIVKSEMQPEEVYTTDFLSRIWSMEHDYGKK